MAKTRAASRREQESNKEKKREESQSSERESPAPETSIRKDSIANVATTKAIKKSGWDEFTGPRCATFTIALGFLALFFIAGWVGDGDESRAFVKWYDLFLNQTFIENKP